MKEYITPRLECIEIRPEERMAAACDEPGSCLGIRPEPNFGWS